MGRNSRKLLFTGLFIICSIYSFSQPVFTRNFPDTLNTKRLKTVAGVTIGAYVAGITFLNYVYYHDVERVPFHLHNDIKGHLQMDKFGHAYTAYQQSAIMYYALRWAGVDKTRALIFGGSAGFIFQAPIEIFDGIYKGWGFSWGDIAANAFGALLFTGQEAIFNDQIFLMKFSYTPSKYGGLHYSTGNNEFESFFKDYNAHTYWFSGGINKLTGSKFFPDWLNIAFGYSINGVIQKFENPTVYLGEPFPEFERTRQYLFSLDVNFTKIPTNKKWLQKLFYALNLIKIPFPALEYNKVDKFVIRPIYF